MSYEAALLATRADALVEFRAAKDGLGAWDDNGGWGDCVEVTNAQNRYWTAAVALAEAVDATESEVT